MMIAVERSVSRRLYPSSKEWACQFVSQILNVCIDEAIIQTMAQNCLLRSDSIGQLKRLSLQDIKAIYRKAGKVE